MKASWEFSTPVNCETAKPNLPTELGAALGVELARITEVELAKVREQFPTVAPPCNECAFVKGTVPNQCGPTLMDAIKCVVEAEPFYCHKGLSENDEPRRICAGYMAAMGAHEKFKKVAALSERIMES